MTWNRIRLAALAGIAITAMLAAVLVTKSLAQDTAPPQPAGGFQGQPMQGGFGPMAQPGSAAMVADPDFLYILQGNRLFFNRIARI